MHKPSRLVTILIELTGIVLLLASYAMMFVPTWAVAPAPPMTAVWAIISAVGMVTFMGGTERIRREIVSSVGRGRTFTRWHRGLFRVLAMILWGMAMVFGLIVYMKTVQLDSWPHGVVGFCLFATISQSMVFYLRLATQGKA